VVTNASGWVRGGPGLKLGVKGKPKLRSGYGVRGGKGTVTGVPREPEKGNPGGPGGFGVKPGKTFTPGSPPVSG
jgi:hypothetical protein